MRHITLIALLFISNFAFAADQALQDKINRLENDLNLLQKKVYSGTSSSGTSRGKDGAISGGTPNSEYELRISKLEETQRSLNGKIEELGFQNKKLSEKIENLMKDNEFRFQELEKAKKPADPTTLQKPSAGIENIEPNLEDGKPKSLGVLKKRDESQPLREDEIIIKEQEPAPTAEDTTSKEYDAAYSLLRESRFDEAEKAFREFIEKHGDNTLAGNSYHWLGEIYYSKKNYEKAAINYLKGYKQYPSSEKAGDSLLKLSTSLAKLDKVSEACSTLAKINAPSFIGSDSLKQKAMSESSKLKCK